MSIIFNNRWSQFYEISTVFILKLSLSTEILESHMKVTGQIVITTVMCQNIQQNQGERRSRRITLQACDLIS